MNRTTRPGLIGLVLAALTTVVTAQPAAAADGPGAYPDRPVRIVVPYAAGGVR
jgi:tripartite-type tricarboxylate transporter receptor subunit TctC